MDNVPAEITLQAYLPDLTTAAGVDFHISMDINLVPIRESINSVLDEIGALTYPKFLTDTAPFLPEFDLSCIPRSGKGYLDDAAANSILATVTGFLNKIMVGCSSDAFFLKGGYDNDKQMLAIDIVFEANLSGSLREALKSVLSMLKSVLPIRREFLDSLSELDGIMMQGGLLLDMR